MKKAFLASLRLPQRLAGSDMSSICLKASHLTALAFAGAVSACSPPPKPPPDSRPCHAAKIVRISIGRDVFAIPTALAPEWIQAPTETKVHIHVQRYSSSRAWLAYCQSPNERPWRVQAFKVTGGDKIAHSGIEGVDALTTGYETLVYRPKYNWAFDKGVSRSVKYIHPGEEGYVANKHGNDFVSVGISPFESEEHISSGPPVVTLTANVGKSSSVTAWLRNEPNRRLPSPEAIAAVKALTDFLLQDRKNSPPTLSHE
jgi:hypothetical protein